MVKFILGVVVIVILANFGHSLEGLSDDIYVIDGHNDLPWRIRNKVGLKLDDYPFTKNLTNDPVWGTQACAECHTDLPRLKAGKVVGQFWAVYVSCQSNYKDAVEQTLEQLDLVHRFIRKYPEHLQIATSKDDFVRAVENGKIASLLGVEGGHSIDSRLSALRLFYFMGVRYMTLTHSCNLPWVDASPVDQDPSLSRIGGITDFGKKVVWEMNRLGMMVDLSHVSEAVMRQVLEITKAPVIFSHSSSYTVMPHHRNVKDEILLKMKKNEGIIMINFYNAFLSPPNVNSTLQTVSAHINHIVDLIGHDHIGLGGDFDGIESTTVGLEDVSKYPNLFKVLHDENPTRWTMENLQKLGSLNLIRVMKQVEVVRDSLKHLEPDDDQIPREDLEKANQHVNGIIKTCRSDFEV